MENNGISFILMLLVLVGLGYIISGDNSSNSVTHEYEITLEHNYIYIEEINGNIDTINYENANEISLADYFIEQNR
jgi:hypothetical protein